MSDHVQVTPNGADDHKSPAMQRLLTEKELARRQMARAEAAVEVAEAALNAANAAWHEANDVRCHMQAAWTAYQQAQTTQTRISELRLRSFGSALLLIGSLFLAAIQVSTQSSLVVLLLFSLPLAWYAASKGRQLRGLQPPRQVYLLESEYRALVKREQRLSAIAAKKSEGYPALVARHQAALADLTYWRHEFQRCKHGIDALHAALQHAKQSQPRKPSTTPQ
jgi:hypothetical protein